MEAKKLTALHYRHLAAGATMVEEDGWQRPERYRGVEEEVAAARAGVAIADISPNGKLDLKGAAAAEFAAEALGIAAEALAAPRPVSALGQVRAGGQAVPARVCRLAADHLLLLTAPEHVAVAGEALAEVASRRERVHVTDVTSVLAGIALLGPRAADVLRKLTSLDLRPAALPDGACAETGLAGVHALLLRVDRGRASPESGQAQGTPLLVYELYVTRDVAEDVWEALLDAGREYGLTPIGMTAYRQISQG